MNEVNLSAFIQSAIAGLHQLEKIQPIIEASAAEVARRLKAGKKILVAGNGGSCSQAMHFAGEVIGRYRGNRVPYPAIALGTDPAASTCILNDFGADSLFARQVEGLGQEGDVFIGLTTSGTSPNILSALKTSRMKKMLTIGWLGREGGTAKDFCDFAIVVPGTDTARIQEAHLVILHYFAEVIEQMKA